MGPLRDVKKLSLTRLLIGLLVAIMGAALLMGLRDILNGWEMDSLALRQRWDSLPPRDRSRISPIVMVAYDAKSLRSDDFNRLFGNPVAGTMSRAAPAYAIRFFKRSRPEAVVFDISFNAGRQYRDLSGDQALVESLQGTDNFASMLVFTQQNDATLSFPNLDRESQRVLLRNELHIRGLDRYPALWKDFQYPGLVPPHPDLLLRTPMRFFAAHAFYSNSKIEKGSGDSRNLQQFWAPVAVYGNHLFPSLPLGAVLKGHTNLDLSADGRLSWPGGQLALGERPLIKWHAVGVDAARPVFPEYSLWDVIRSELVLECRENPANTDCRKVSLPAEPLLSPAVFQDKYVLVGFTLKDSEDVHDSIYGMRLSGVYMHANILDNLLHDELVHPAPLWMNLAGLLLLLGLMTLAAARFRSVLWNLLIVVTLTAGYYFLAFFAYRNANLWLNTVYPILGLLLCFSGLYIYRYYQEYRQRQQLRFAFGKYVSPGVMQLIENRPETIRLGGERREMTFLFCDIRGFTKYSDHHTPEEVQALLTRYFSLMNGIILHEYQGTINKLIGDAIMAYWGFPVTDQDHAFLAVSAAMKMRQAIRQWQLDASNPYIDIGIGINTGDAVVGNIGSEDFMDFTVIGDAVNVASRLESANKEFGTQIIISAATYEKVKDRVQARSLGKADIRGKEAQLELLEPLDPQEPSAIG